MSILTEKELKKFKEEAIKGLKEGKPLSGKEGILTPLIKSLLEEVLNSEMEVHLDNKEEVNRRNGYNSKIMKSEYGNFELNTPRDRNSTFEPQIVKKRQVFLGEEIENKIISLYGLGMSYSDINTHISDLYGTNVSDGMINEITDKIIPHLKSWQSRSLSSVYPFIWLDAIFFKVKEDGKVVDKAIYNVIGLNVEGKKELLGMYISDTESANFWLNVLSDLQTRGVEDILIASIDNLSGFKEAIKSIFPKTEVQLCIVHQVRNSLRYVTSSDSKEFLKDLKKVYQANSKDTGEYQLLQLEEKWGKKYPIVIKSWKNNWNSLSTFFDYSKDIRKIIYTTNPIESFHRQIRKVTKSKSIFGSETGLLKLLFLVTQNISKKWNQPVHNWALTLSQLHIKFGDRLKFNF